MSFQAVESVCDCVFHLFWDEFPLFRMSKFLNILDIRYSEISISEKVEIRRRKGGKHTRKHFLQPSRTMSRIFSKKSTLYLENLLFWKQIRYFPHFVANHEDVAQTTSDTVQGCSEELIRFCC